MMNSFSWCFLQHCPEPEIIPLRTLMINQAPGGLLPEELPGILNICADRPPPAVPSARMPLPSRSCPDRKMLSGANAFEIRDIQSEAGPNKDEQNVTMVQASKTCHP